LRLCLILDLLPLHLEGARIDDDVDTVLFDEALVHDDSALGYGVVRVPVLPPRERLEFVLDRLFNPGPL
jgi:predicted ATPase